MHHKNWFLRTLLFATGLTLTLASLQMEAQTFGVYRQLWSGLSTNDATVKGLTNTTLNPNWPNNPDPAYTQVFTNFETEQNLLDGYGQRVRGFVVPPMTGAYTFSISSGDASSLFLSADETTNKTLRCWVATRTNPREWAKETNQMSAPIALEAGRRFYIEVLHKAASGGDNLAVRWQLPNGVIEEPLTATSAAGTLLIPCNGTNTFPGIYAQPTNTTAIEGGNATFTLLITNWAPVVYQWKLNGTNLPLSAGRKSFYTVTNLSVALNDGQAYSCVVTNASGAVTSVLATLTVVPDTFPPTLVSASSVGPAIIAVGFSKTIDPASATNGANYSLSGGLTVNAVSLADPQTVWLAVSPAVTYGSNYTVTVNNVLDRAPAPNTIVPNSQISFTAVPFTVKAVGGASPSGSLTTLTNGFDLNGTGNDIGSTSDQFQFSYQLVSGNFDVSVRVQGLSGATVWSKAGLMARDTLDPGSRFASALATPTVLGEFFEYRSASTTAATSIGGFPPNYPSTWLRLQRAGNQFTGYSSYDGQTWTVLGSATISLNNTVYFGLAVASHVNGQLVTAQFRDLAPTPASAVVGVVANPSEPLATSSRKTALVISEFMYKPAPRTDGRNLEFIELYNANPYFFDMSGYQLSGSVNFTFPAPMIIPGNSFLVVAAVPADLQAVYGLSGVMGPYTGNLKKSGAIQLVDEVGAVRLEIPYSNVNPWPVAADGTGHSLVLARPSYGEADSHAWDISDVAGGSPGTFEAFRPSPLRNVLINELLAHTEDPTVADYVELYNHSNQTNDLSGCVLTDDPTTNKFVIPPGTLIAPGGFAVFYQNDLGFGLKASGQTVFFRNPDGSHVLDAVQFDAQADGVSLGRWPDGADVFYPLAARTPGAPNGQILIGDIVINELMYKPISGNDDDQFIELYNKGANSINLGGWKFLSGITFTFPPNTWMDPDDYLVVARNMTNLFAKYTNLNTGNTIGEYSGKLPHSGGRIALTMPQPLTQTDSHGQLVTNLIYVVEDELTFVSGGRWGQWSAGGGSSLELVDPRSNHRLAPNWADSDETSKAPWVNIENTGVLDNGSGSDGFVQIGLLDSGECMVDAVEVRPAVGGTNLVLNSDFESGLANWFTEGCFVTSTLETNNAGFYSRSALHLRCTDRMWTGANSAEGKLATSPGAGQTATLRFKARWLHGWPEALLRLDGNYLEATGPLAVPGNLGTPGQRNSRAVINSAPAIYEVSHTPAVPAANQAVTVTARVHDSDGLQSLALLYRVDPSFNYTAVAMNDMGMNGDAIAGDGLFSATIPGLPANAPGAGASRIEFYLAAKDTLGASNTFPAVLNEFGSIHECVVMFGDTLPASTFGTYHIWISTTNATRWANLPNLSNEGSDATFVYGNRVIYNTKGRFSGSPYHQQFDTPYGSPCHYKWVFPEDAKLFGATSFNKFHAPGNGAGDDASIQREQLSHTFLRALGVPWLNRKYVNIFVNGVRRGTLMEDAQTPDGDVIKQYFPNDSGGFLYKMQPWFEFNQPGNTAGSIGNNNESWCNVMPYTTTGGGKKLARYRWNFLMRQTPDSANNYTNVFSFVDAASSFGTPNYTANMTNFADMENFLRVAAGNHAAGNWDSYLSRNAQNLYGYIGTKGTRYSLLMWDFNIVIGNSGSSGPGANLFEINSNGQDSNTAHFFDHPPFRRAYWRALQELINGPLDVSKSGPLLDAKFASFKANGFNVEDPNLGIKSWLSQAQASIATQLAVENATNFSVLGNNFNVASNSFTLTGKAPVQLMSLTVNGESWPLVWTSVTGWSLTLPVHPGANVLTVLGYDRFGNAISGASNTVTVVSTPPPLDNPVGNVVITEIMFNPLVADAEFVELYNASASTTFDLSGWVFNGLGYTFPPGSSIAPGRFLVLAQNRAAFAGAYGATVPVFDTFVGTLQFGGETLTLIQPGPPDLVIDKVRYQSTPPWPTGTNGIATASSLEVIDPLQDNRRAGNWATTYVPAIYSPPTNLPVVFHPAVTNNPGWHFVSITGTNNGTNAFFLYLDGPGNVYIDDLSVVDGTTAGVGFNFVAQGDFEGPALDTSLWQIGTNYINSGVSSDVAHSGSNSLHIICTTFGNTLNPLRVIEQVLSPSPTNGEVCTLSFWYYTTPFATNVVLRFATTASTLKVTANVQMSITPGYTSGGYYLPPQVISPALVVATPGRANSAAASLVPFPPLWINEVQADNLTGITNRAGQHTPWLEVYNAGTNTVSLSGLYLANNYTNLTNWAFPGGASILAGEFKVVFCDGQTGLSTPSELHTSFLLPGGTGSIALTRLYNGRPQVLDFIDYSGLTPDRSYGDFPDGQPFARQTFFYASPGGTNNGTLAPIQVLVNEWMSANTATLPDPADGNFDDWFELYNAGPDTANLAGYYLANNLTNKLQFQIPSGYVIDPGGFLLIWADKEPKQNSTNSPDLHTNFRLSKSGASIGLYTPEGTAVDFITYAAQASDSSSGRYPDGANSIYVLSTATPGGPNSVPLNTPPVLQLISDQTMNELTRLKFIAQASDTDIPPQTLTFSLDPGAPAGASINAGGLFQWRPTEFQGPGVYPITVRVTDNGTPNLSVAQTFTLTVNEVNSPPSFVDVRDKYVKAGTLLSFPTGVDSDWPAQNLSFTMDAGAPQGAGIGLASGVFSWTPTDAQAPGTYSVTVHASDDGIPPLSATAAYTIYVLPSGVTLILVNVSRAGNSLQLNWTSTIGSTYQVQYKDDLSAAGWTALGANIVAVSSTSTISDNIASHPHRVYRVMLAP